MLHNRDPLGERIEDVRERFSKVVKDFRKKEWSEKNIEFNKGLDTAEDILNGTLPTEPEDMDIFQYYALYAINVDANKRQGDSELDKAYNRGMDEAKEIVDSIIFKQEVETFWKDTKRGKSPEGDL